MKGYAVVFILSARITQKLHMQNELQTYYIKGIRTLIFHKL